MSPIPQTSFLVGTFFAASYSKPALARYFFARIVSLSKPCQLIILLLMKKVMYGHERARKKVERTYVRCRTHLCDMNT